MWVTAIPETHVLYVYILKAIYISLHSVKEWEANLELLYQNILFLCSYMFLFILQWLITPKSLNAHIHFNEIVRWTRANADILQCI